MLSELDNFYLKQEEPNKSCFMALRDIILASDARIDAVWKYGGPFFYFKGKMFCYLWKDKKTSHPYIGIAKGEFLDHPLLVKGSRKKIKVFPVDPNADIDVKSLYEVLDAAKDLY